MSDPIRGQTAICGLGITEMGKVYGHDASWFAGESIRLAVEDAGLDKDDIDGLLVNPGITGMMGTGISIPLQGYLGLRNLRLLNHMNSFGATASAMVQYAAMAVHHGMANYVACIFSDAPLQQGGSAGAAYGGAGRRGPSGMASLMPAFGFYGANTSYALAARRYMERYGDHQQRPRPRLRDPASLRRGQPACDDAPAADAGGLPQLALDCGTIPPARLLPRLQRRGLHDRHDRRTLRAT